MNFNQLVSFYHVARTQSFSKAAELTFCTQPAVSQKIRKLEEYFDIDLFDRSSGIALTQAGERLFSYARIVVEEQEKLLHDMKRMKADEDNSLRVATHFAVMNNFVMDVASKISQTFPDISIALHEASPLKCLKKLQNGEIDIAVLHSSIVPDNLDSVLWKEVDYVLVVPKDHALARKRIDSFEEILPYTIIMPGNDLKLPAREIFDGICAERGLKYEVSMENSNIDLSMKYVTRGFGVSCVLGYEKIIKKNSERLAFVSLRKFCPPQHIVVASRPDASLSKAKQEALDFFMKN